MNEAALRQEIVALIPRLRRFSRVLTGGHVANADDLVQTALEKALTRLHQFAPGTRLDSWLFRIVQTSWIDDRRRARHREESMETEALSDLPNAPRADEAASRQTLNEIGRAIAALPEDQRALCGLVLVEGYSYQEAADMTGVPIGTVMSRLSRARQTLATRLGGLS